MRSALANETLLLEGSQRAVLLVHGLGGGPYEVQRLAERLHRDHGVTAYAPRLPGHERATRRMPASRWPEWYQAVETAYDHLAERHERVDLVGFSMGALLVLHLTAARRLAPRLVLLAPLVRVFRPRFLWFAPERLVRRLRFVKAVPRRRPPLADRALRDEVAALGYRSFSLEATQSALELNGIVMKELGGIRARALILQGRRDTVVDPEGAPLLRAWLGPQAKLCWFDNADHLLTLDEDSDEVLREAAVFLAPPCR
jgi:carboxylesterase